MPGDIVILLFLVLLNGIFSAAELAVLSVNHAKVRGRAEDGNKQAILLKNILDDPSKFLASVQIGLSLTGLFSLAFAIIRFGGRLSGLLQDNITVLSEDGAFGITIILIVALVSYLLILLGNIVPRGIALKYAEPIAFFIAGPVKLLTSVLLPFTAIITVSSRIILRLAGIDLNIADEDVTEEEIRMLIDAGEETGSIDENEKEMIHNIFEFDNKTADDIATHRKDIVALPVDAGRDEIIETAVNERFSRVPVYEGSIDNIIGILHLKDFLNYIFAKGDAESEIDLRAIIRKPYFVPLSKKTDKLFEEMKKGKVHVAIVVDEYGGTAGLVTMEDLIEEIVGNIYDEYDEEDMPDIEQIYGNVYCVNGTADLETVSEFFGVSLPYDDHDTISGFIVAKIGHIPTKNEMSVSFEYNGLIFKVWEISDMRVTAAIVSKIEVPKLG